MRRRKKTILSVFTALGTILMAIGLLTACGKKTSTYKYEGEPKTGITSVMTYTVEGNKVVKQTSNNSIDLNKILKSQGQDITSLPVEKREAVYKTIEKNMQSAIEKNGSVKGYSDTITRTNGIVKEKVSVDYNKASLSEIRNLNGASFSGNKNAKYVEWEKTKKFLEDSGFNKVE